MEVASHWRELLPHVFTLAGPAMRGLGGCFLRHFLAACPKANRLPVRKYAALCCPDFPHPAFGGKRQDGLPFFKERYFVFR